MSAFEYFGLWSSLYVFIQNEHHNKVQLHHSSGVVQFESSSSGVSYLQATSFRSSLQKQAIPKLHSLASASYTPPTKGLTPKRARTEFGFEGS